MEDLIAFLQIQDMATVPCTIRPGIGDGNKCTVTAQIVAYWLTGDERGFTSMMREDGIPLAEWDWNCVWLAANPQLVSIDIQMHKFCIAILPAVNEALLIQSNKWPGEPYSFKDWIHRRGHAANLPYFRMDKNAYHEFMVGLIRNTTEDMINLFGTDKYQCKLGQAQVMTSKIIAL